MIYETYGKYYKMIKSPRRPNGYALWKPVRKFLCFWIRNGENFYLDMHGFKKVK